MGITGLLRGLGPLLVPTPGAPAASPNTPRGGGGRRRSHHISSFAGRTLAVDASSWLHKGAYSCAMALVEAVESGCDDGGNSPGTQGYTRYVLNRCEELLGRAGAARVILVFDGKRCPLKANTNAERERRRARNLQEARRLRSLGRREDAEEKYKLCVKVTDGMAKRTAREVEQKYGRTRIGAGNVGQRPPKVSCVFSPYEADAQLAGLCRDGKADAAVTEDSDLLVYSAVVGVPFPVIYKLDRDTGECDVLTMDWLLSSPGKSEKGTDDGMANVRRYLPCPGHNSEGKDKGGKKVKHSPRGGGGAGSSLLSSLRALSRREAQRPGSGTRLFVQACVLSGCDYAPSRLSGVGPVTAFRLVVENAHRKHGERFRRVLGGLPRGAALIDTDADGGETFSDEVRVGKLVGGDHKSLASQKEGQARQTVMEVLNDYEDQMARSEAVFYYHHVLDSSLARAVPLVEPPSLATNLNVSDDVERRCFPHLPSPDRFIDGLSFVGVPDIGVAGDFSKNTATPPQWNSIKGPFTAKADTAVHRLLGKPSHFGPPEDLGTSRDEDLERKRDNVIESIARTVSMRAGSAHDLWSTSSSRAGHIAHIARKTGEKVGTVPSVVGLDQRKRDNPFSRFVCSQSHPGCAAAAGPEPKELEGVSDSAVMSRSSHTIRQVALDTDSDKGMANNEDMQKQICEATNTSETSRTTDQGSEIASVTSSGSAVIKSSYFSSGPLPKSNKSVQDPLKHPSMGIVTDKKPVSTIGQTVSCSRGQSSDSDEKHCKSRFFSPISFSSASPRRVSLESPTEDQVEDYSLTRNTEKSNAKITPHAQNTESERVPSNEEKVLEEQLPNVRHDHGHSNTHPSTNIGCCVTYESDDSGCVVLDDAVGQSSLPPKIAKKSSNGQGLLRRNSTYISPFQSGKIFSHNVTKSTAKKKQRISPLMAGFARQRSLSLSSAVQSPISKQIFNEGAVRLFSSGGNGKKRQRRCDGYNATIGSFFRPLNAKEQE